MVVMISDGPGSQIMYLGETEPGKSMSDLDLSAGVTLTKPLALVAMQGPDGQMGMQFMPINGAEHVAQGKVSGSVLVEAPKGLRKNYNEAAQEAFSAIKIAPALLPDLPDFGKFRGQ